MSITILLVTLLIGAISGIVVAGRRMQGRSLSGSMFRRGIQYVLLYSLVLVVANGGSDLAARALGHRAPDDDVILAQSVTAMVIALPITVLLAWWIYRSHRKDPLERASLLYQAYLTAASLTAATMTADHLGRTLTTAIGRADLNAVGLGGVLMWGLVWVLHWRLIQHTLVPGNMIAHTLLGATIGLALGVSGLLQVLAVALELFTAPYVMIGPLVALGSAMGTFMAGAVLWVVYWLISASTIDRGTAWHIYVLLLGVAGGLVTMLVGVQALVWQGLVLIFGDALLFTARLDWPHAVAALLVGATVWWYHRAILVPEQHAPVQRVYQYLAAGIGVVAAAAGFGLLFVALIDAIAPASLYHHPLNTLLGALTLLGIGAGLWAVYWQRIQIAAQADPQTELTAVTRRIYLVLMIGGPIVAVIIALISAVAALVHDMMQGQLSIHTLYNVRTELGFLGGSVALIAYHAAIVRQDQTDTPQRQETPVRHGMITLVGRRDPQLVAALEQHISGSVRLLPVALDHQWDIDAVLAAIATYDDHEDIVIIVRQHGVETHPAEELRYVQ